MSAAVPLVEVRDLRKSFRVGRGLWRKHDTLRAVDGVSFDLARGEVLGLVGESGSGKTTVGRMLLRLIEPSGGTIHFDGRTSRICHDARCARYAAICSSCSRTRTPRSIRE